MQLARFLVRESACRARSRAAARPALRSPSVRPIARAAPASSPPSRAMHLRVRRSQVQVQAHTARLPASPLFPSPRRPPADYAYLRRKTPTLVHTAQSPHHPSCAVPSTPSVRPSRASHLFAVPRTTRANPPSPTLAESHKHLFPGLEHRLYDARAARLARAGALVGGARPTRSSSTGTS